LSAWPWQNHRIDVALDITMRISGSRLGIRIDPPAALGSDRVAQRPVSAVRCDAPAPWVQQPLGKGREGSSGQRVRSPSASRWRKHQFVKY